MVQTFIFEKIYNGLSITPTILEKIAQKHLHREESTFDFSRKEDECH